MRIMKHLITLILAVMTIGMVSAQNYIVVNSEKVFKSIDEYNKALNQIEELSATYQKSVDVKFQEVERLYNSYVEQRASLSASARQAYEQNILQKEAEATKYQESLFGTDGELMKRRLELIQPIQQRVFSTIESISKQYGYDLVIDIAANPTLLYYSEKVDMTNVVIEALK
jgi:outer membrane protein